MVLVPISPKFFKEYSPNIIYNYSLIVGLNKPWSFFSPTPSSEVYFKVKALKGSEILRSFTWPSSETDFKLTETKNRRVFAARKLMASKAKWRILANYFCRKNDRADSIYLKLMSKPAIFPVGSETPNEVFNEEEGFSCKDFL